MAAGVSRAGRRVASLLAIAMLGTTLLVFAAPSPASAADAAKSAPPKVKTAMNRIGSYLASVGSLDFTEAAQQLGSKNGKAYSNALVTYSTYVDENC